MVAGVCPAYLPNIHYMSWLISQKEIVMVTDKPYQKQTFRNRTEIYGANGKLKLTIPIVHSKKQKVRIDETVAIYYENRWQQNHWRSLETAYRSSPFFEFYEDDFYPFFHQKIEKLMDFNTELIKKVLSLLDSEVKLLRRKKTTNVFNNLINAKHEVIKEMPLYQQVF